MTIRQIIVRILERDTLSALDLAGALLLTPAEVESHLEHLRLSLKHRLRIEPARCRACGFVFRERRRLDAPGRCPRCHEEQVEGPWFRVGPRTSPPGGIKK